MTLPDTFLHKLAEWRPTGERQTLNLPIEGSGWGLALTVDRQDELGSLVWEIAVRRAAAPVGGDTLQARAERVSDRVKGLLEQLTVVEVDTQRNEALLRSDEPSRRGDRAFYYEVLLKGGTIAEVRRFRASSVGAKREQVAFALTHEVLAGLVTELAGE